MWGMHWAGWVFWILVIIGVIWLLTRRSTSPPPSSESSNETPMEILKRKYAAGELSTEEYEERKEHLQRDQ